MSSQRSDGSSAARVNRAVSQAPPKTPTSLPTTSPSDDADAQGLRQPGSRHVARSSATPAERNAKTGTATPAESGRTRCSSRSAGDSSSSGSGLTRVSSPRATPATVAWIAGVVDECPDDQGEWHVEPRRRRRVRAAAGSTRRAGRPPRSSGRTLSVVGEEHRDDRDRAEVVDHGEGQQERPQRRRQVRAHDGQHGEREGDVGRHRDGPTGLRRRGRPW